MIGILTDERVGLPRKETMGAVVDGAAVFHALCTEDGRWLENGSQQPIDLASFVGKRFERPPGVNWFYLIWTTADERLFDALNFLVRQNAIKHCVSVILLGPVNAGSIAAIQARLTGVSISGTVWVVGNESTDRLAVSSEQRLAVARAFVGLLDQGGQIAAQALGIEFPDEQNQLWHFLGCLSLLPIPQDIRQLQRRLAQAVLKKRIEEDLGDRAENMQEIAGKPSLDVREILTFGIGSKLGPDQWPVRFHNVFANWRCSLFRWRAEQAINGTLELDYLALVKHWKCLCEELGSHSAAIRREGREQQQARTSKLHGWIKGNSSLSSLALLLEYYFPKFSELDLQVGSLSKTPCLPCADPSEGALKREFITLPKDLFGRHARRLFSRTELLIWLLSGVVSGGLAYRFGLSVNRPDLAASIIGLWTFLALIRTIIASIASWKIRRELMGHRIERIKALSHAFSTKIERVKELTRKTITLQFISQNRRLADRLGRLFGSFFGRWIESGQARELPDLREIAYKLVQAGITKEKIDTAQQRVAGLGSEIVKKVLEGDDQGIDLASVFRSFGGNTTGATAGLGTPASILEKQSEFDKQWDSGIPILAQLGTKDLQSGLIRLTFIPSDSSYDDFAIRIKSKHLGVAETSRFIRLPVAAPVVLRMKALGDANGIEAALKTTEIQR